MFKQFMILRLAGWVLASSLIALTACGRTSLLRHGARYGRDAVS